METMLVEGLTLYFDAEERDAAELVRRACEKSVRLIRECWNLEAPEYAEDGRSFVEFACVKSA
jgi:hypothetical protein